MAAEQIPYITTTDKVVGAGHDTLPDVANRVIRFILEKSGHDVEAPFTGFEQVYNVIAFGAKGDGVTDDIAAIQAAVDRCLADGGGTVYFPARDYFLGDGTILVDNGHNKSIHFRGDGMFGSRLMKGTTATGDVLTWNCYGYPCTISNMGITSAFGGNGNVDGLVTTDVMNGVVFERIWFNGLRNGCVLKGTDIFMSHCLAELCISKGYVFDRNVNATLCSTYRNAYGFLLQDTSGVVSYPPLSTSLVGCRSIEDSIAGVYVYQRSNVEITSFQCQSSNGNPGTGQAFASAIFLDTASKVRILAANIGNVGRGIQFLGACSDIDIDHVTIDKCSDTFSGSGHGIEITNTSSNVSITEPRISRTYRSGIFIGGAAGVTVRGGTISSFGQGAVANDNAGVLIYGDGSTKGTSVEGVAFNSATGKPIAFFPGSAGAFFIGRNTYAGAAGQPDYTNAPVGSTQVWQLETISANHGDADYAITQTDVVTHLFGTVLTANRNVTLPAGSLGRRHRVVRTGLGAFTLTVGGLKVMPASTAAWCDVEHNGTTWVVTAYGTL